LSNKAYKSKIQSVPGLANIARKYIAEINPEDELLLMEFILFGLSEHSLLSRHTIENGIQFKDMLSSMFSNADDDFDLDNSSEYT